MRKSTLGFVAIPTIIAAGLAFQWHKNRDEIFSNDAHTTHSLTLPPQPIGKIERTETPITTPAPNVDAPTKLDDSDDAVQAALNDFAPQLLQWLTPPEQIRKWVLFIDAIADGALPQDHLPLVYSIAPFQGSAQGETMIIDNSNFERSTALVNAIVAIPPKRLLQYYQHWQPVLDRAYRELGRRGNFDTRLRVALSRIAAARPLPNSATLTQAGVYFVFTDPQLEKASELQKWFWRIGPKNSQRLQEYAEQFTQLL